MPISCIEKRISGVPVQKVEPHPESGKYVCLPFGSNTKKLEFSTLDEVADYLRANPKAGVRMQPGWSKISRGIHIDGVPR